MTRILDSINSPKDIKNKSIEELTTLSAEIREAFINKMTETGGHMAPNLGFIEPSLAMHYVFNSPTDKFVFDISHQCYTHKIATGRKDCYINEADYTKFSGFTCPQESEHDNFVVGHTSTSISLATGLAKARDLQGQNHNVVAVIGDGSLTGGMALEGLNNAINLNSNMIIIVNDNNMSIAENVGAIDAHLTELRENKGNVKNNIFKSLGYDYIYVEDGNDIKSMIDALQSVKDTTKPVIVHIKTVKGKGYKEAEDNKEATHYMFPRSMREAPAPTESYTSITVDYIKNAIKEDKKNVVVSVATPIYLGFNSAVRAELGTNFVDVGIAEEHAVAYASAIAKGGCKPIMLVVSSFIQRAYDQINQDLAMNKNPATMLVYWSGITGGDQTHLQIFDTSVISNIPNMVYLAPTTKEEHLAMLSWANNQTTHPVAIKVPNCEFVSTGVKDTTDYGKLNTFKKTIEGKDIAIIGLGNFYHLGKKVVDALKDKGYNPTLINPCYITGVDKDMLNGLKDNHKLVVALEDGLLDGGFAEKIARHYADSDMKVILKGANKEFTDRVSMPELYNRYRLNVDQIVEDILKTI